VHLTADRGDVQLTLPWAQPRRLASGLADTREFPGAGLVGVPAAGYGLSLSDEAAVGHAPGSSTPGSSTPGSSTPGSSPNGPASLIAWVVPADAGTLDFYRWNVGLTQDGSIRGHDAYTDAVRRRTSTTTQPTPPVSLLAWQESDGALVLVLAQA